MTQYNDVWRNMTRYDVTQKIEKTLNNTHTETQKQTNDGFR